jgi:two-component system, sensor histidine kinase and response regulator
VTLRLEKYLDQPLTLRDSSSVSSTEVVSLTQLPSDWRATCSLLVAEDNIVNRKLLSHMLKRLGFQLIEMVENGKEAVDLIAKSLKSPRGQQYHLILMDCQMPELDGYDATRIIREMEAEIARLDALQSTSSSPPLSPSSSTSPRSSFSAPSVSALPPPPLSRRRNHIPIVALTANASDSDRQLCLSSGMDDFCTKPLTIEKLDDILCRWISSSWSPA